MNNGVVSNNVKVKKSKVNVFLILIILALIFCIVYLYKSFQSRISVMSYNCTPITASREEINLDLNSTLVLDLYSKVKTNIREDLASPEMNNQMLLYLAYRQILETDKYDSNCNLFSNSDMINFTCEVSTRFVPKAFKEDVLKLAIKKMYGENTSISLDNIQLGSTCIGGYQYIPSRGEFVQGLCGVNTATSFKVDKSVVKATSYRNSIIIIEEVKYHENEKMELPSSLKSGYYYYTFRLDSNYNYVFVSKDYKSKI